MQGNKNSFFFSCSKTCDPFVFNVDKVIRFLFVFKGKYSKTSVKDTLKGYCFSFPPEDRQGTDQ